MQPTICAGTGAPAYMLRNWYEMGAKRLASGAAPGVLEALEEVGRCLGAKINLRARALPGTVERLDELPAVLRIGIKMAGELRIFAVPVLAENE